VTRLSRVLLAVASVLLLGAFVLPLWRIELIAPQYPEGLGMLIRVNAVTGIKPNDLANINGLNHYIGMKAIEPDAIPELRVMPWVVAGLSVLGLVAAAVGRRRLVMVWLAAFVALAVVGLIDFWRWEYDYGHNIDFEHAIIKVPGMTYQPPLIGSKQLLNFTARSWPAGGTVCLGLSFLLGVAAVAGRPRRFLRKAAAVAAPALLGTPVGAQTPRPIIVTPAGAVQTVGAAVQAARPGATIIVQAGVYREPTIVVTKPLTIVGEPGAVLDGEEQRQILTVQADDVTIRGLELRRVGTSYTEDRAAIKVQDATNCVIENNRIDDAFFGIYLARTERCRIAGNTLRAKKGTESSSGNGIHLWTSNHITIEGNTIAGHRDGIYLEFAHNADVHDNVSEENLRYGMHFMYSDDCEYVRNTFRHNGSGVAVMYTKRVVMTDNRFEDNWGAAAYGLLLKEILEPRLTGNHFARNTVGLLVDGVTRLSADRNEFNANGWGVKLMASAQDGHFTRNAFLGNTFDVATNSRETTTTFANNYWDEYTGYDVNRDGMGDVPHHPVRLFSLLVANNPPVIIALRSPFAAMLDVAERVVPSLTPEMLVDASPMMRRPR
jgi:nitrous oxidase accessory protein